MKYAISSVMVLLMIVSVLLVIQYQAYSNKDEEAVGPFNYTQEIEIVYRDDSLDIRQHFANLPNRDIEINWPKQATNPDCFMESKNSCARLNETKTGFKKGDIRSQSISYIIPLNKGIKNDQLLADIFATLKEGNTTYSTVHITTNSDVKGSWISGLPQIGEQKLKLINYSLQSGTGTISDLYYQTGKLKLQESSEQVSVYSEKPLAKDFKDELNKIKTLKGDHVVIIHSNKNDREGERLYFLKDLTVASLRKNVLLIQVKDQYDFGKSPGWLVETVASFRTKTEFESKKGQQIVKTLKEKMSKSQLEAWNVGLENLKGKKVNAKVLDNLLSKVFNKDTEYFSLNESIDGVFPFVFNDAREMYVNDKLVEDVFVILKDGLTYYKAIPLLNHLGYKTSVGPNGLYVQNSENQFRFPINYGFFMFNGKRYNSISEPIEKIGGDYYIEETWLTKLFIVDITKKEKSILIKPLDTTQQ